MAKQDIQIIGMKEVLRGLNTYEADILERVKVVTERRTKAIFDKAMSNVPVGPTGNLKNSGRMEVESTDTWVFGRVGFGAPHAHLLEFGTVNMDAKPFLTPAFESEARGYEADVKAAIEKDK
jgi:HK97 gp10 family phage protein